MEILIGNGFKKKNYTNSFYDLKNQKIKPIGKTIDEVISLMNEINERMIWMD